MADVVLQNAINTIQVQNEAGETSGELPIGALASNIAYKTKEDVTNGLQSTISVQKKLEDYDTFIENLSTDNVKYIKDSVTQTLTKYLEKNITTDNKSTGIVEKSENDDSAYVTAKGVIDYLAKKTNTEIKSTAEKANNNLVTDNAVFKYVKVLENKLPIAAESFNESENAKYVTVELFNSKYISMFEGSLTDETDDVTTLVNPNQVVTYVKSKTETGRIEENSNKLVTSGTLYTKFSELNIPNKAIEITSLTEDDSTYVTPKQVVDYIKNNEILSKAIYGETPNDNDETYITPLYVKQAINNVVHTGIAIDFEGVNTAPVSSGAVGKEFNTLTNALGYVRDASTGNYIVPAVLSENSILARIAALEEAVKLNTTTTN